MGRIIAIANQKGGVGKTTTAINLSACLAEAEKRVLTIDMDPQGNTTSGLGIDKNNCENTIYQLILGECSFDEALIHTEFEYLDLIPSNVNLAGAEIELLNIENREYVLHNEIEKIKDNYDFIIIDCPPSLNMLTVNAMTTASTVLVPIQCEYYALEGLSQLMYTINLVQERLNPSLHMEGVVFTMYDALQTSLCRLSKMSKRIWILQSTRPSFQEMYVLQKHQVMENQLTYTTANPQVQKAIAYLHKK